MGIYAHGEDKMQTVRPCPFCRREHCQVLELHDQPGDAFSVGCDDCGALGPMGIDDETAVELWNDRAA